MEKSTGRRRRKTAGAVTIADVASLANVSPMTVSRVLNNVPGVKAANIEAVRAAMATLRYSPNPAAQALAGASLIRIALVCYDLGAWFLNDLLISGLDEAKRHQVQIVVDRSPPGGDPLQAIEHLIASGIDAVLLPPPFSEHEPTLALLRRRDIPTLALTAGRAAADTYAVFIDDYAAARAMTDHLIALGHRRIAFITGVPGLAASELRLAGFRDALECAGIEHDPRQVVDGLFTFASGFRAAETLLRQREPPTAIFAANDDMAAAVIAAAHKHGLDVPADLTVCGCDDTNLATAIWPTLTTIRQPLGEMSRRAVAMLAQAVRSNDATPPGERHHEFAFELIRRQSDAVPRRRVMSMQD